MRQLALAAILLAVSTATQAQETRGDAPPAALNHHSDLTTGNCGPREGLSLCVQPADAPRGTARRPQDHEAGKLTKFTRLAGVFMGRVDAAEVGRFKFRFKLELR